MLTVISGVCGMGKTFQIKEKVNEIAKNKRKFTKEDEKILFVTIYRSEIFDFTGVDCVLDNNNTLQPDFKTGKIKYSNNDFTFEFVSNIFQNKDKYQGANSFVSSKIKNNKNIAITHQSLAKLTLTTIALLKEHNYHLFIDETPTAISIYDKINAKELKALIDFKAIEVDEKTKKLSWALDERRYNLERYMPERMLIKYAPCYLNFDKKNAPLSIINELHPELFTEPINTYVFTYLFEGTIFYYWLGRHNIQYLVIDWTKKFLVESSRIAEYDNLIAVHSPTDKKLGEKKLGATGYNEHKDSLKLTKGKDSFYCKPRDSDSDSVFSIMRKELSSFLNTNKPLDLDPGQKKEYQSIIDDIKGYKAEIDSLQSKKDKGQAINEELLHSLISDFPLEYEEIIKRLEEIIAPEEVKPDERLWTTFKPYKNVLLPDTSTIYGAKHFIAYNIKARNDLKHVKKMALTVDIFPHYDLKNYLNRGEKYQKTKQVIDENKYATHELIQWLFRSRIRDGKKIAVLIISDRMRLLLENWMKEVKRERQEVLST